MSMFFGGCPLCWNKECDCNPKEIAAYYEQQKEKPRTYGAGIPGYTKTVYRGMGKCVVCGETVFACTCPAPKFRQPVSGSQQDVDPGPVIIVSTGGDDYSVLDRVDPRLKNLAVNGIVGTHQSVTIEMPVVEDGMAIAIPVSSNYPTFKTTISADRPNSCAIQEASDDNLSKAFGPGPTELTPENKYWILRQLGFQGKGKGKFKHIMFEDIINFDIQSETLIQLVFRIFKAGYKNSHTELLHKLKQQYNEL